MKELAKKIWDSILKAIPIIIGVLMLIEIINPALKNIYPKIFTGNFLLDPILGAIAGSISFGIPVISYITGGELLKQGVSILAITAFILTWSSVGIMTYPIESASLGKKFTLARNGVNLAASVMISVLAVFILRIFV